MLFKQEQDKVSWRKLSIWKILQPCILLFTNSSAIPFVCTRQESWSHPHSRRDHREYSWSLRSVKGNDLILVDICINHLKLYFYSFSNTEVYFYCISCLSWHFVMQEIHGLLRQGVAADKISTQLSPWSSALFEFLPPFIKKQVWILWHETSLCFPQKQMSMNTYKMVVFVDAATSPSWVWWFCAAIPGKKNKKKKMLERLFYKKKLNPKCLFCFLLQIETEKLLAYLVETEMNKRLVCSMFLTYSVIFQYCYPNIQVVCVIQKHSCQWNWIFELNRKKAHTRGRNSMLYVTSLVTKLVDLFHQNSIVITPT